MTVFATLDTVTVTPLLVALFPAASLAMAVNVCEPLLAVVVSQDTEYGEAVSRMPKLPPSNWNCTLATPTLSLAFAETVAVPETVAPVIGAVMDIVGGVVSAVTVSIAMLLVAVPAELLTTTPNVEPLSVVVVGGVV